MAASPRRSPTSTGNRRSMAAMTAATLNSTAHTWPRYHAEPVSATYQKTVPKAKTRVRMRRRRRSSAKRPSSSQTSPTAMAPNRHDATCCGKSVPKTATNGMSRMAGTGG